MAPIAPAYEVLSRTEAVFGPEHFETGDIIITAMRDLSGVMKVAHKLQRKLNDEIGGLAEVKMECLKYDDTVRPEWLEDAQSEEGRRQLKLPNICQIPEDGRVHPYLRQNPPTLEVAVVWQTCAGHRRCHILWSLPHPVLPTEEEVPRIFDEVSVYFHKRWLLVELYARHAQEAEEEQGQAAPALAEVRCGSGLSVDILACHPAGFASGNDTDAGISVMTHVSQCVPMTFSGMSNDIGEIKICFLPAAVNKIQVTESESYYPLHTELLAESMNAPAFGITRLKLVLTPKAHCSLRLRIFVKPKKAPVNPDCVDVVDWSLCDDLVPLPQALAELCPLDQSVEGQVPKNEVRATSEPGFFECTGIKEGMVELSVACEGYKPFMQPLMLLVGENCLCAPMEPV